jgi:hypothetical protein
MMSLSAFGLRLQFLHSPSRRADAGAAGRFESTSLVRGDLEELSSYLRFLCFSFDVGRFRQWALADSMFDVHSNPNFLFPLSYFLFSFPLAPLRLCVSQTSIL